MRASLLKASALSMIALSLAVVLAGPRCAAAMDAQGRYGVYGSGDLDCASWTREARLSTSLALKDRAWVLGYISAYNRWVSNERSVLGSRQQREVMGWIDKFCKANPRETINGAVESLIFEIEAGG